VPGSVAAAQAKLEKMGLLAAGVEGEAVLKLRTGGQLRAGWAVVSGPWLHYVDEDGRAHTTGAANVGDIAWD
jgi:hypothetical protein